MVVLSFCQEQKIGLVNSKSDLVQRLFLLSRFCATIYMPQFFFWWFWCRHLGLLLMSFRQIDRDCLAGFLVVLILGFQCN